VGLAAYSDQGSRGKETRRVAERVHQEKRRTDGMKGRRKRSGGLFRMVGKSPPPPRVIGYLRKRDRREGTPRRGVQEEIGRMRGKPDKKELTRGDAGRFHRDSLKKKGGQISLFWNWPA